MNWYVILYLLLTVIQINGSPTLSSDTHEEIVMMIEDWIKRNEEPISGERVYHVNMNTNGNTGSSDFDESHGKRFNKPSISDNPLINPPKRRPTTSPSRPGLPFKTHSLAEFQFEKPWRFKSGHKRFRYKRPNNLHGFKYHGQLADLRPQLFDLLPDNKLQWSDLTGHNLQTHQGYLGLLDNQFDPVLQESLLTDQFNFPYIHGSKLHGLRQDYSSIKSNKNHHHHPPSPDKSHEHHHKHEHNHDHKHHYHITKEKKKQVHHVTIPVPYPVHIKIHRHHKDHHHHHHKKDLKPILLAIAVGLPLLLVSLLLPLALLFITALVTLLAALRGGIFGSGASLIPVVAPSTGTGTGTGKRSIRPRTIYDDQILDSLYSYIMRCIHSEEEKFLSFNQFS